MAMLHNRAIQNKPANHAMPRRTLGVEIPVRFMHHQPLTARAIHHGSYSTVFNAARHIASGAVSAIV